MTANLVRVFEGTYVPSTFETLLVPKGEDPDGLGAFNDQDRILHLEYKEACAGKLRPLKRLTRLLYEHQKYQLKNSHVIADAKGEPADNMTIEDICPWLAKLGALTPSHPDHVFDGNATASRYEIPSWVFSRCELEGIYPELIGEVLGWNEAGALEWTAYPGDCAIDGDGNYPIFVAEEDDVLALAGLELVELPPDLAKLMGEPPIRKRSRTFVDCQYQTGHSGNTGGRPRRPRETEEVDERRPHFFDTLMPPDSEGGQITFGEHIFAMAKHRAISLNDKDWLLRMAAWANQLDRLRGSRKKVRANGFVYHDTLEVTRIDIAIRHLSLVDIQWRKKPSARWVLKPWLVSSALERMKKGSLTREEMQGIYLRTQTPQHVDWPEWWPEDLRCKHSQNGQLARPRRKISGTISKP